MASAFKKTAVIILVVLGGLAGYWLAQENKRFFELPYREEPNRQNAQERFKGINRIVVGMDTWQVKEAIGPPDKRYVVPDDGKGKKEVWTYGGRRLYFINGFLTKWQE